jgi:hypothetical protein
MLNILSVPLEFKNGTSTVEIMQGEMRNKVNTYAKLQGIWVNLGLF